MIDRRTEERGSKGRPGAYRRGPRSEGGIRAFADSGAGGGAQTGQMVESGVEIAGQDHISFRAGTGEPPQIGVPALQLARQRGDRMHGDDRRTGSVVGHHDEARKCLGGAGRFVEVIRTESAADQNGGGA